MPSTAANDFFKVRRSFTEIKQEILGKYFDAWCNIHSGKLKEETTAKLLYLDLHVGDGINTEDCNSEPVKAITPIFKSIIRNRLLNAKSKTYIYNKSKPILEDASQSIEALPYYDELINPPVSLIDPEGKAQLTEDLTEESTALVFMDPFASMYAQQFLLHTVNTTRSDLFMMLEPDNITKVLGSKKVSKPLGDVFGDSLNKINTYCRKEKDKSKRQSFIMGQFISLLQDKGYLTLCFKVNLPDAEQADKYLLFSSPHGQPYRTFKETLLPYSICQEDGIAEFTANKFHQAQVNLFEQVSEYTMANLLDRITQQANLYKYKSIDKIYEMDSIGTNYSKDNYVIAFEQLRKAGKVELLNSSTMQTIRRPTLTSVVKYKL